MMGIEDERGEIARARREAVRLAVQEEQRKSEEFVVRALAERLGEEGAKRLLKQHHRELRYKQSMQDACEFLRRGQPARALECLQRALLRS